MPAVRTLFVALATLAAIPAVAAPEPGPEDPGPRIGRGGYDKGFVLQSPDGSFKLRIGGLVQGMYAYGNNLAPGDDREETSAFSIPRVRIKLGGNVFGEDVTFQMDTDFGKGGFVTLKDGYVEWKFAGDHALRAGQYKRPFSRQQLTSDSRLELIDRSVVDDGYGLGRDIGLMVHDGFAKSPPFEYAVGVFNGTGDKPQLSADVAVDPVTGEGEIADAKLTNVPGLFHPLIALRAGGNVGEGSKGYSELDLEGGAPRFGAAGNVVLDLDADDTDDGQVLLGADYYLKASGFAATGGYVLGLAQADTAWTDQALASMGFWQQASYVAGGKVAPAVRYARFLPDGPDNDVQEVVGGVVLLFHEHALKLQNEVGLISEDTAADAVNALLVRSQVVLDF